MRLLLKILKIIAVLIIAFTVILFSASLLMQDRVAGIILKSLNKNISTKYEFESVKLSFLRKFPKASLDLKNVLVHSSPGFDQSCFAGISTDTLLSAAFVSMEFSITDIINGIYNIDRVGVKEGHFNILTDTAGLVNYEITAENGKDTGDDLTIDLDRINLTDIKATYNNQATKLIIKGLIETGQLKSRISGDEIDFTATSGMRIDLFRLYNTSITKSIGADLDVNLHSSDSGVLFNKGTLRIENINFDLKGFVSEDDILDLDLSGDNIDLSKIKKYVPDRYQNLVQDYDPSGILKVNGRIKGPLTRTSNPLVEIAFKVNRGHILYGKSDLNIDNISFDGFYSNGTKQNPETSSLSVKDLKARLGSSEYTSAFTLTDFTQPHVDLFLKGIVIPAEIKEFFNIQSVALAEGLIDMNLKLTGELPKKDKYEVYDIFNLNPEGDLSFNSFSIKLKNSNLAIDRVTGSLKMLKSITADKLHFTFKDHTIDLNGEFYNLPEWLAGKPAILRVNADVTFSQFIPEVLFPGMEITDTSSADKTAFSLPGDVILDLNFDIDTLLYKSLKAENIKGTLSYKPRLLNLKSLNLNSLNGTISGNGFFVQNTDKSLVARGSFNLENIDINDAFTTFHNFGQDFLKAENISGTLSGLLSVLIPMDSLLNPQIKSLTAEGKYVLVNGILINFEPVIQLSSFISLSELETIRFEKLENDFFIKNNYLFIPQMDIKSSAADFSVNGKHSFDDDYEYHVKILLSEILSKKIKKPKPSSSEFGVVQDDGLGRTSVLLKIEDKGDETKVSYDLKAATSKIKNDIKAERQTLKTILNQEYGWFKYDSAVSQKPAGEKRFKITWEETDTTKTDTTHSIPVKKESVINNIFRKK
ncbi:MAG: AsmA-like C-terminal region-containing protein [Bacteroidales bacterium]|nr:AsmA-like C-terminal region-containing protein [Bacteroidales bacterium]